jgi:hypothetical protein
MRMSATIAVIAISVSVATFARQQNPPGAPPRDAGAKPPIGTAIISGVVVSDDAAPAPMRRVRVTVRSDAYGNGWSATTDDEGRFVIGALPAGRYSVQASKPAWLTANYGATRPGRPGTPIAIADGQKLENVRLQLSRGSVITGAVRDRSGEPVPAVTVSAMKYVYSELTGERVLARTSEATTDDQGVYRCFGLTPGDYVIVATLRSGPATALMDLRRITAEEVAQAVASAKPGAPLPSPPPNQGRPPLVGYAPVYFPGSVDVARATMIKLGTSEEKGGLNITLDAVPTARVDAVPNLPETANRQSLQVYLVAQQATPAGTSNMATGRREADGRIVFNGVTPGNYIMIARAAITGATPAPAPGPAGGRGAGAALLPLTLYASADLTVEGRDMVVPLDLKQGMTVSGRITFDNPDRAPNGEPVNIALTALKSGPALSVPSARADPDGTFRFVGVPPARYRLDHSAGRALDEWSPRVGNHQGTRSAGFSDRDPRRRRSVRPRPAFHGSAVGTFGPVADIIGKSCDRVFDHRVLGGARVLASVVASRPFASARDRWRFLRQGLPAGDYYIAALTDVEPGEWYDPAFLAKLIATSAKVVVKDGARTVQDLMIK